MFDFAWSQIALIAVVALIVIGPKDMPVAIRAITNVIKKARRMAAEFQTHVDEMVREANLDEVRNQISDIRNFDFRTEIEKVVDPDRTLRDTFASDPLNPKPAASGTASLPEVAVAEAALPSDPVPLSEPAEPEKPLAPAFIPPNMVPSHPAPSRAQEQAALDEPPPFIPPEIVRERQSRMQA
jgi:sec-independent protein translocase protein TatB